MDGSMTSIMNPMNQSIVPGDFQSNSIMEWMAQMGMDPNTMAIGAPAAPPVKTPGMVPGMPPPPAFQANGGWDAANQQMAWLAQNAIANRRANRAAAAPKVPVGTQPGGAADLGAEGSGPSKRGSKGGLMQNVFGDGPFGQLAGVLFPGIARPKMLAPLPFTLGKKFF
jgi:hypothetical protein